MDYDLVYLAGLVDGEGSAGYFSERKNVKVFTIEVKMTSEEVIDWLVGTFGGNKVARKSTNVNWQNQWRWRIRRQVAEALYKRLEPHLKIKAGLLSGGTNGEDNRRVTAA